MAITSDQELRSAVAKASDLIQEIQDYCGRVLRDDFEDQIPQGYDRYGRFIPRTLSRLS